MPQSANTGRSPSTFAHPTDEQAKSQADYLPGFLLMRHFIQSVKQKKQVRFTS
jgi:hypothetical protein